MNLRAAAMTGLLAATAAIGTSAVAGSAGSTQTSDATQTSGATQTSARPGWRWVGRLTKEQRACMQSADLTRPLFPLSEQERGELRTRITAAAAGCDIKVPTGERAAAMRAWWSGLSDEQRTCLKTAAGTRPVGPLTRQQRQEAAEAVKKAAETCDVRLPMRK